MRTDLAVITILALAMLGWLGWQTREDTPERGAIGLGDVLGEAPEHFRRVTGPEPLEFPADHAAHPDYRSEWWYFTGNLDADDGRRLGFQFTLFRFALDSPQTVDSAWATDSLWMAHLALSDGRQQRFYQSERFARGAQGLAGADRDRWWLRDWRVERRESGWHFEARAENFGLALNLVPERPIVFQGERGYSRKGPEPGNASRYYSLTRLRAEGTASLDGASVAVDGLAWLDREWGSNQLSDDLAGWDWFALQLEDGRDVMVYRLRHPDGRASSYSAGIVVEPDGSSRALEAEDFEATVERRWRDEQGHEWPLDWRLKVAPAGLDLRVEPIFDNQRWTGSVDYWEGAMDVFDAETGKRLGRGYLELSGYGDRRAATR